jgi:methionyl-tRNA formyltransferase
MSISILFFGTNEFSAIVLESLSNTTGFHVAGVVTQPTRPTGREHIPTSSPVKLVAQKLGLSIFEPETLKNFNLELLPSVDLFVVYAYGLIIPQAILDLPKYGALNIHPSLLPKYRGPTPVQAALINGDKETGITIMALDEKMDHGPILGSITLPIESHHTTKNLTHELTQQAIPLLTKLIPAWIEKTISSVPQNHSEATFCKLLTRDDGHVDFKLSALEVYNRFRGLTPWPGLWVLWRSKRMKLLKIMPINKSIPSAVVMVEHERIFIGCGNQSIELLELQLEGKKAMTAKNFILGNKNFNGAQLE